MNVKLNYTVHILRKYLDHNIIDALIMSSPKPSADVVPSTVVTFDHRLVTKGKIT